MPFEPFKRCAAALAFLFLASAAAEAQQPNPAAVNAARQLVEMKGAKEMFDAVHPGVIVTVKNNFLRTNPHLNQPLDEVAAQIARDTEAQRSRPLEEVARAFAERFSLRELQDAIAFYKTPLGRKLIEWEARTLEEGLDRAQKWADSFANDVMARMRQEMAKRGHKI